jgi:hypothetical protein
MGPAMSRRYDTLWEPLAVTIAALWLLLGSL